MSIICKYEYSDGGHWATTNIQTVGQYEYADGRLILIPRCSPDDNTESGTHMFKYAVAELN